MIRIKKRKQTLNSFVRISLLVKFVFTAKLVDEKTKYIIVPCTPFIANFQSRSCELAFTLETRKKTGAQMRPVIDLVTVFDAILTSRNYSVCMRI